jgi:adenylylsulfate kinase
VGRETSSAFAIWLTGLPASGKSAITSALLNHLRKRGIFPTVLESDVLRQQFSTPTYDERDRDYFYGAVAFIGKVLTEQGISVIFDATANLRTYRDRARGQIPRFVEVYVKCPLEVCMQRDPKGIYRRGNTGAAQHVPGLQAAYEPPLDPEIVVQGDQESPDFSAGRIVEFLESRGLIPPG